MLDLKSIAAKVVPIWVWPILLSIAVGASVLAHKRIVAIKVAEALEQKTNKIKADQADAFAREVKDVSEVSRINRATGERLLVDARSDAERLRNQAAAIVSANCTRTGAAPDQRRSPAGGEGKPSTAGAEAIKLATDAYAEEVAFLWAKLKACGSSTGSLADLIDGR